MHNHKKAFTLIELMIVIAIIGILAAIAMPNFHHAREKARMTKCHEITALLTRTAELYYIECRVYPNTVEDMKPFINGNKTIACPTDGTFQTVVGTGEGANNGLVYICTRHGCASATWGG